jgi:hypothetical protein
VTRFQLAKIYNGSPTGCGLGQLLDRGIEQVKGLASYLKKAYRNNFITTDKTYLYSTDTQRTFATLDVLVSNIFPRLESFKRPVLSVNTHEFIDDFFALNIPSCKRFVHLRTTFKESPDYERITSRKEFMQCQQNWKKAFDTELDLKFADDCMISAYCNNATLPHNQSIPEEILECVISSSFELRAIKLGGVANSNYYQQGQEICQIGAYKVFTELNRAVNDGFLSGLYSIHDETYVCLLTSLGMWDGIWPKYASFIAFEYFSDDLVRVVRDGVEIGRTRAPLTIPNINNDFEWRSACEL